MKVSIFFTAFLFLAVICASFTYAGGKGGKGKGGGGDGGGKGKGGGGGGGGGKGKGKGHLIHDTLEVDQLLGNQMWDEGSSFFGGKGKKGK